MEAFYVTFAVEQTQYCGPNRGTAPPAICAPQELIDRAKAELPRCLTPEQRQALFLTPMPPSWCLWPYDATTRAVREAVASSAPK
jgi:hypothetical protein